MKTEEEIREEMIQEAWFQVSDMSMSRLGIDMMNQINSLKSEMWNVPYNEITNVTWRQVKFPLWNSLMKK
jgi:hypothetical protein